MMAKDPEQRLPSAAAVRHELLSWADKGLGLPLDQPEDPGYAHSWRTWKRRSRPTP